MLKSHKKTVTIHGREISFETGKIARQANGSVMVRSGDTMILSTACSTKSASETADFFPLRVDYQEKFSSAGKTLGGFLKREGKPTEKEILTCRLIDRPLRPMFPEGYYNEVQILSYVLSYDGVHLTDPLAICAASAALVISDIPLIKPVAGVRVGLIDERFVVNPTYEEQQKSRLDLMLAGTEDAILMIEGHCDFLTEEQVLEAVEEGHEAIKVLCEALKEWQAEVGKPKQNPTLILPPKELLEMMTAKFAEKTSLALAVKEKQLREEAVSTLFAEVQTFFNPNPDTPTYKANDLGAAFKELQAKQMRRMILKENRRSDGRTCDEIRPISIEMGLLPRTHGSALFTRGETQTIAVCTLGGQMMGQRYEDLHEDNTRRFYLQYSFPPFSVGEVGRVGSPGRREIGHGKLAERALSMSVPDLAKFPYTIRLESNITESNGSSSMATVCGCSLAMMEAGVPVSHPIAGIAMGLILEGQEYAILSDILGAEDALGDMDFKVAGNHEGITAFQLDIKIEGITHHIMQVALAQAKQGRLHILNKMMEVCSKPKDQLSVYAPRIETMKVKASKIGTVIGPGGKQIRAIVEETGVEINIDDDGVISLSSNNPASMERAKEIIRNLTAEVEIDKVYRGKVVKVMDFGAFVELVGGKEGLCHISQLAHERVEDVRDVCKEGDLIDVKVLDINERGQIKLSRKVLLPPPNREKNSQ